METLVRNPYVEMVELYAPTAEGFGGREEYRDKVIISVDDENGFEDALERAKVDFCLKYGVDFRLVGVFRDPAPEENNIETGF